MSEKIKTRENTISEFRDQINKTKKTEVQREKRVRKHLANL